jgi:Leucine Rich repeat
MFLRSPSLTTPCAACGKSPCSITLFSLTPTTVGGALLCKSCSTGVGASGTPHDVVQAVEEEYTIGNPPPSISSSLWAGKVPHLRALALKAAQCDFNMCNGKFFRDRLASYLQERVLKVLTTPQMFESHCIPCEIRPCEIRPLVAQGVLAETPMSATFRVAFQHFARNASLSRVILTGMRLTVAEVRLLSVFLQCGNQTLLDLSFNPLGVDHLIPLGPHLRSHSRLATLRLCYSRLGDDGVEYLARALVHNASVTALDLACASFGVSGCTALSELFRHSSTLVDVNLAFNDLGYSGAYALADGIGVNRSISTLNLRSSVRRDPVLPFDLFSS